MAATVRSDLYDALVRKIGYSVGLEFLVPRVRDVLEVFCLGTLDGAAWRDLVRLRWKRTSVTAEQNIADVYAQLDLLRRRNNFIHPLPGLETMALLAAGVNPLTRHEPDRDGIVRSILLLKVLEADGDIFLNALAAEFATEALGSRLTAMLRHKRRAIAPHFPQAVSIRRLAEAISIRNQSSDGAGAGARKMTYAERSRLLMASTAPDMSKPWTERDIAISNDYLEKTCVTRKGWAVDLGLYDRSGGFTPVGRSLLSGLRDLRMSSNDEGLEFFIVWPYPYQLARLNLSPADLNAPAIGAGQLATLAVMSILSAGSPLRPGRESRSGTLSLLVEALRRYRATGPRGVIRHELPLYIAEPALAWWQADAGHLPQDLRAFIESELRRSDRGLDEVTIRGTEGGLVMMEVGGDAVVR